MFCLSIANLQFLVQFRNNILAEPYWIKFQITYEASENSEKKKYPKKLLPIQFPNFCVGAHFYGCTFSDIVQT